ncbi:MAG TPA: STAS domain-containing protein [Actinomycetota bacterium]|jgi:rsbT antagonist protein RsbS|nr:STAS domain-containing protein [Actinomycetota bacterium]
MSVPILKQGDYLIASIQSALADSEVAELRDDVVKQVGSVRARGLIVDVTALDVIDSFAARAFRSIAEAAALCGTETAIVGIRPDVAAAMVQFDLDLKPLQTALDLEEGLALLDQKTTSGHAR